jgi:hypothetical protein
MQATPGSLVRPGEHQRDFVRRLEKPGEQTPGEFCGPGES